MASSLGSSAWPSAWQRGKYEKVRPNRGIPRYRRDSRSLSGGKTSPGNYPTRYASIHHICESGIEVPTGPPPSAASSPKVSTQNAICAVVFHGAVQGGQCRATNVKVSAASPSWVYARVGIYNAQGQLASDLDQVVINLTTHEVIGPTNVGFCQPGPGGGGPIGGYGAIPAVVLTSLGLSPCRGASAAAGAPPPSRSAATAGGATSASTLAAT